MAMLLSGNVVAQRHGRPDSAQNYEKSIPEPTLTITIDSQSSRWKRAALAAMTRSSISVPSRKPGSTRVFSGVTLSQLLPSDAAPPGLTVYETHHGFFHTQRLDASDLEPGTDLLIADRVDQRAIAKSSLFYVIATTRGHQPLTIGNVTSILIRTTPQ